MTPVGFVGVGEIAAAIVDGLQASEDPPAVLLSPRGTRTAAELAARHPRVTVCADNQTVVDGAGTIVLAVGPDAAADALADLRLTDDHVFISLVAGLDHAALRELVGDGPTIVRAVPLPAARRRASITALLTGDATATTLFERVGTVVAAADEAQLAALTAVTATMSAHLGSLAVLARWLAERGVADADRYVAELFRGVAGGLGTAPLAELARAHETPGGLNEQLRTACLTPAAEAALTDALDAVDTRIA